MLQFSTGVEVHVGFPDFDRLPAEDLERLLLGVEQRSGVTQTASAIRVALCVPLPPTPLPSPRPRPPGADAAARRTRVLAGSRAGASKALIVVTDGQKYGDALQYGDVIPEAERAGVVRYAIGVSRRAELLAPHPCGTPNPAPNPSSKRPECPRSPRSPYPKCPNSCKFSPNHPPKTRNPEFISKGRKFLSHNPPLKTLKPQNPSPVPQTQSPKLPNPKFAPKRQFPHGKTKNPKSTRCTSTTP